MPRLDPAARWAFDAPTIARGASLAAIGSCRGCHTRHGGQAFAGGEPMHSPYGTIYSTNITPDPDTGIGRWTVEAFQRAMRRGVRADGEHLYPAFPYDHFTRVTDEDNRALYAFLMSQPAVRQVPPANDLIFPANLRSGIRIWKMLFFEEAPPSAQTANPALARGQYLVEGLGHCGSCHTPRNFALAEKRDRAYDGGDLQGWHAYAIDEKIAAPIPWDAESLAFYLRRGYHQHHGIARGTMGLITNELAHADEADVKAIAAYVVSLMGPVSEARKQRAQALLADPAVVKAGAATDAAATLYETTCRGCHSGRGQLPFDGIALALSLGLNGESPRNLVNVIVHGVNPAQDATTPMMPGFGGAMSDAQIEALVHWLRASLTDKPPWTDVGKLIKEARDMKPAMLLYPPGGAGTDPAEVVSR